MDFVPVEEESRCADDGSSSRPCRPALSESRSRGEEGSFPNALPDSGRRRGPSRVAGPFFTTKPEGKGTGLGLAMMHGFAKQSDGAGEIGSAPGRGTTVTLQVEQVGYVRLPAHPEVGDDLRLC